MSKKDIVLILAPHTDDGELGCGGTISKYIDAGIDVHYYAFSTCKRSLPQGWEEDTLEKELIAATSVLGIPRENVQFFDYDVRTFKMRRQDILDDLIALRAKLNPTIVYMPSSYDLHQDHEAIHEEGVRAFKNCTLYGYEMPWNNLSFTTNCFVALSDKQMMAKVEAMKQYKSQLHRPYVTEEFLKSLAMVRGVQCNAKYAEAFEVIRLLR
jgi:N-acetylglucosamine malate deacetylase 1